MLSAVLANNKIHDASEIRTIKVCGLIDQNSTGEIKQNAIDTLIENASDHWQKNVGIRFNLIEEHETSLDVMKSWDAREQFRAECSRNIDAVIVFTNKDYPHVLGQSNHDANVCWIFSFNKMLKRKPCFDVQMVVEHEFAHLFHATDGLGHNSFMNPNEYDCHSIWPDDLKNVILDNKYKNFQTPN